MKQETKIGIGIAATIFVLVMLYMWVGPLYTIWSEARAGEARLAHSRYAKEIAVQTAKAAYEAAMYDAGRDTVIAHGKARANIILGASITPQYLNYLWIQNMEDKDHSVIYVPSGNLGMPLFFNQNVQPSPVINQQP